MSFTWTDNIVAKKTEIRKIHIDELRSHLDATSNMLTSHIGSGGTAHSLVTSGSAGFMSGAMYDQLVLRDADTVDTYHAIDLMVPIGGIIIWSGVVTNIPAGWALCDGNNGTPNLQSKFIMGAGSTVTPATTGGSDSVSLDITQIPAHRHVDPYAENSSGHMANNFDAVPGTYGSLGSASTDGDQSLSYTGYTGGTGYTSTLGKTAPSTTCVAHSNIPPYYALAYIMKITGGSPQISGSTGDNADFVDGYHAQDIINMIPTLPLSYDKSHLHAINGYQELSNGLILQWGKDDQGYPDSTWRTITFPKPFPHSVFTVTATPFNTTTNGDGPSPVVCNFLTTSFKACTGDNSAVASFTWFAIGN